VCRQCGKLFFEKKLGAGLYCSPLCRKRYNDSLQQRDRRLCRERQNQWIRYRRLFHDWPKFYTLQKDSCAYCPGNVESGKCPELIRKNAEAFKKYGKQSLAKK
jgi:hypothetical protein